LTHNQTFTEPMPFPNFCHPFMLTTEECRADVSLLSGRRSELRDSRNRGSDIGLRAYCVSTSSQPSRCAQQRSLGDQDIAATARNGELRCTEALVSNKDVNR